MTEPSSKTTHCRSEKSVSPVISSGLKEYQLIQRLASGFRRSPAQINSLFGSDSEILRLQECGDNLIALTTDGIVEEIQQGLYRDPFLVGWMTVMVNLSDLAAVGARPGGILIQLNLPPDADEQLHSGLRQGIEAACRKCGTFVLGGDINSSSRLSTGGTAIGILSEGRTVSRKGCRPGDLLYTTAPAGLGTAFAFRQISGGDRESLAYQPTARLNEGNVVRQFASACIDTSDGLIPGLAQLAFVNDTGFELTSSYREILHPSAQALASQGGFPYWFMLAGPHGDFELLFTISAGNQAEFIDTANSIGWTPLCLGSVMSSGLVLDVGTDRPARTDATLIANLFLEAGGDAGAYLESLKSFHKALIERE